MTNYDKIVQDFLYELEKDDGYTYHSLIDFIWVGGHGDRKEMSVCLDIITSNNLASANPKQSDEFSPNENTIKVNQVGWIKYKENSKKDEELKNSSSNSINIQGDNNIIQGVQSGKARDIKNDIKHPAENPKRNISNGELIMIFIGIATIIVMIILG